MPSKVISADYLDELVPLVIGVTGHRELPVKEIGGEEAIDPSIEEQVSEFFQRLSDEYPATPLVVLSPFSPGADCLVAKLALRIDARVVPVLPEPLEDHIKANRKKLKTCYPYSVEEFRSLLARAEAPIVIPELTLDKSENFEGVTSIPHLLAGVFVARHCHILLAVWDGRPKHDDGTIGGTAQNVHFHRSGELPDAEHLEDLLSELPERYSIKRRLLDEPETGLIYYIDTVNTEDPQPHDSRFLGRESNRELDSDEEEDRKDYVERFKKTYSNINKYNSDLLKLLPSRRAKLRSSARELIRDKEAAKLPKPLRGLRSAHAAADVLAAHFRDQTHRSMAFIFWVVGIAAASFVYYAHMAERHERHWLLGGYLLLLAIAIFFYLGVRKRSSQDKYQDYRALAEGLRVEFFWRLAGLSSSASGHYLRKHKNELDWIRSAVRACALMSDIAKDIDEWPSLLLEYWIKGESRYFGAKAKRYHEWRLRLREIGGGVLLFGVGLSIFVLLNVVGSPAELTGFFAMLAAVALLALIIVTLSEIAGEPEEAEKRARTTDQSARDKHQGDEYTNRKRKARTPWIRHPLKSIAAVGEFFGRALKPSAIPLVVGLIYSSICLISDLKARGLYLVEFFPLKLLPLEIFPGLVVLTIGAIHIIHRRLVRRDSRPAVRQLFRGTGKRFIRRKVEKWLVSLKNSLYGINLGLLITLALLHSNALPDFLRRLMKNEPDDPHDMLVAAMGLMALVAALLHTYAEQRALAEQYKLYKRMKSTFSRARLRLEDLIQKHKLDKARELVHELGKETLEEHGDWVMLHRERPMELPRVET